MKLDEFQARCPVCGQLATWDGREVGGNGTSYEITCPCTLDETATMPVPILPVRESRAPRSWDEWTAQIRARLRGESA